MRKKDRGIRSVFYDGVSATYGRSMRIVSRKEFYWDMNEVDFIKICNEEKHKLGMDGTKAWEVAIQNAVEQAVPDQQWYDTTKISIFEELLSGKAVMTVCHEVWNDVEKELGRDWKGKDGFFIEVSEGDDELAEFIIESAWNSSDPKLKEYPAAIRFEVPETGSYRFPVSKEHAAQLLHEIEAGVSVFGKHENTKSVFFTTLAKELLPEFKRGMDGQPGMEALQEKIKEIESVLEDKDRTIELYKNYGCLAAEKRVVYTYGAEAEMATCSEVIQAKIPEGWELYETSLGDKMVQAPWGWNYGINEVLSGNEHPCFFALDKHGREHFARLQVQGEHMEKKAGLDEKIQDAMKEKAQKGNKEQKVKNEELERQ